MDTPFHTSNLLLRSLSDTDLATLVPNLQRGEMERELVLGEIDVPVERIHFPEGGVVSCVATENGSSTEVGLIGLEGMVGISVLFGDPNSGFRSFVQVDHDTSLSIAVADFNEAVAASATMRTAFLRYAHTFIIQISFGLVACAQHLMEARLARWLLMCHDRTDGDTILLTHEFMAMMISAQRSGVTMTLHNLEGSGMIRSTRGQVVIRDRHKLEVLAGDSYGRAEARYSTLIAPFGKGGEG